MDNETKDTLAACGFILQEDANGVCRFKLIATRKAKRYPVKRSNGSTVLVSVPENK